MKANWLTIGIEDGYQIVDMGRDLKSHITTLLTEIRGERPIPPRNPAYRPTSSGGRMLSKPV
jgi:hypothetical protein